MKQVRKYSLATSVFKTLGLLVKMMAAISLVAMCCVSRSSTNPRSSVKVFLFAYLTGIRADAFDF